MKIVTETLNRSEFRKRIIDDVYNFRSYIFCIFNQFKEQQNLKENLPDNHVYIWILPKTISADPKTKFSPHTGTILK